MEMNKDAQISKIRKQIVTIMTLLSFLVFVILDGVYFLYLYFYKNTSLNDSLLGIIPLSISLFVALVVIFVLSLFLSKKIIKPIKDADLDKEKYVAKVTKELTTPINNIKANALILQSSNQNNKWVKNILGEVNNMNLAFEDVASLTNVTKDEPVEISEFDLSSLIKEASTSYDAICFNHNLEYVKNIENNVFIKGSKTEINKMTRILIENAIKNVEPNGIIQVALFKDKDNTYLSIYNSGCKIKDEDKERVFARFYRSNVASDGNNENTNLGLEILQNIIEKNKYVLSLDSKENTYFKINIKL